MQLLISGLWVFQLQSRRLHLATVTFLWPEQRCQILCIFGYFRLPWGNRKFPLARATLPIHLYFLQLSCQGRPLRSGILKLPEIQKNWQRCSGQSNFPVSPGQSRVAKYTKNLATLLWPEERCCCQVQPSRLNCTAAVAVVFTLLYNKFGSPVLAPINFQSVGCREYILDKLWLSFLAAELGQFPNLMTDLECLNIFILQKAVSS